MLHFDAENDPIIYNYDTTHLNVAYFVTDEEQKPVNLSDVYDYMVPEASIVTLMPP